MYSYQDAIPTTPIIDLSKQYNSSGGKKRLFFENVEHGLGPRNLLHDTEDG